MYLSTVVLAALASTVLAGARITRPINLKWCDENDLKGNCQTEVDIPLTKGRCRLIPNSDTKGQPNASFNFLNITNHMELCMKPFWDAECNEEVKDGKKALEFDSAYCNYLGQQDKRWRAYKIWDQTDEKCHDFVHHDRAWLTKDGNKCGMDPRLIDNFLVGKPVVNALIG